MFIDFRLVLKKDCIDLNLNKCLHSYFWSCLWFYDVLCTYIYVYNVGESAMFQPFTFTGRILIKRLLPSPLDLCFLRLFDVPNQTSATAFVERDGCLMQVMKVMKNLFNIKIQLQIGDLWMAKSDACKSSYQEPHSSFHHCFQQ